MAEGLRKDEKRGKPIKGEFLFGKDDLFLWASLIILDARLSHESTMEDFRQNVERHIERGARLIHEDLEAIPAKNLLGFFQKLLHRFALSFPKASARSLNSRLFEEIRIRLGHVSKVLASGMDVEYCLNRSGDPPHIALMGSTGRGKTYTGMQIASQIVSQARIPILIIDPKGDFVQDGKLSGPVSDWTIPISHVQVGESPVPLDFLPPPGIGENGIQNSAMRFRDTLASCCRGAGEIQRNRIHEVIEGIMRSGSDRSLDAIRNAYEAALKREGGDTDSVLGKLNDLSNLNVFEPKLSAQEFFSRSWVISTNKIESEDLKSLVSMLILDIAKTHLLRQSDSEKTGNLYQLRNLIVIDEARRIMASKKSESLADLVRLGRSKGVVVMLLSQDPTDFQGASDDFMSQIGTCVIFPVNSGERGISSLRGLFGQRILPDQLSDPPLSQGLAFCKWPGAQASVVQCWSPKPN